jgi:hypothetical protein
MAGLSWEAVSAIGSLASVVVIAVTVVVGARQLRVTQRQLEQLRGATQLEGTLTIFADLTTPEFFAAARFTISRLAAKMRDDAFRREVAVIGLAEDGDHPELLVLRTFERVGTYVKHGLLDGAIVYDYAGPVIRETWSALVEVVEIHRRTGGTGTWENFQHLAERCAEHDARFGADFYKPVGATSEAERDAAAGIDGPRKKSRPEG